MRYLQRCKLRKRSVSDAFAVLRERTREDDGTHLNSSKPAFLIASYAGDSSSCDMIDGRRAHRRQFWCVGRGGGWDEHAELTLLIAWCSFSEAAFDIRGVS